jgi:hypothetical protein
VLVTHALCNIRKQNPLFYQFVVVIKNIFKIVITDPIKMCKGNLFTSKDIMKQKY